MLYFIDVIKDFESFNHVGSQSSVLKWWQSNIFQAFCVAQMYIFLLIWLLYMYIVVLLFCLQPNIVSDDSFD